MGSIDLTSESSFINFTVEDDEISQTPKYITEAVTVPSSMKNQYGSLEKRNRCLGIGLFVVVLAMCAMTAFVVKEKLDHDGEKRNSVGNHQVSLDQLREEFNVTVIHLQEMILEGTNMVQKNVNDTVAHIRPELKNEAEQIANATYTRVEQIVKNIKSQLNRTETLVNDVAEKNNYLSNHMETLVIKAVNKSIDGIDTRMNNLSKQVQSTVNSMDSKWNNLNATIARIRPEVLAAVEKTANATYIRLEQVSNKSISEMKSLLNQTKSLVDEITKTDSQKDHNKDTKTTPIPPDFQLSTTFKVAFTVKRDEGKDFRFYHGNTTQIISGVPINLSILVSGHDSFEIRVYFECVNDENFPFKWPLTKAIQFVILTESNYPVMTNIFQTDDKQSCQDPTKFNGKERFVLRTKLPEEVKQSVMTSNFIRVGLKLLD